MVAVMLVILDHLFGWPHGGFIGVDVFFVISGFLITGALLHTIERDGKISFSNFYRRRIRRIVPAATLVLVVTVVVSFFVYGWEQVKSITVDAASAFFFVSNWRFAEQGTDYFSQSGPVSPIRQYWSLSVEEQFYFVWPFVMFVVAYMLGRRAHHRVRVTGGLMLVLVGASFTYAMIATSATPTMAYFSTFTRAWELGVGALLAIFIGTFERIHNRLRVYIAWAGLITIMVGAFVISEDGTAFPAPLGLLPVLGSAMVILAGVSGPERGLTVLTNPVSRYIGDISYSLYLWHWPVIVLLAAVVSGDTLPYYVGAIMMMFAISIVCYESFEDPIRRSKWLETKSERSENAMLGKSRWRLRRVQLPPARKSSDHPLQMTRAGLVGIASIFAVGSLVLTFFAVMVDRDEANAALSAARAISYTPSAGGIGEPEGPDYPGPASEKLAEEITEAMGAARWPDLNPSMAAAIAGPQAPAEVKDCGGPGLPSMAGCSWGSSSAPQKAVIVGDSVAMTYVNPLRLLAEQSGGQWMLHSQAMFGCAFMDAKVENEDKNLMAACPARKANAVDVINQMRPDVVFVTNTYEPRLVDGRALTPEQRNEAVSRQIAKFAPNVKRVVFLAPPPSDVNIASCYSKTTKPASCMSHVVSQWSSTSTAESELASKLKATYIESQHWFCVRGNCPVFVGTTPTRLDQVHMTPQYGEKITPAIGESLRRENLF